MTCRSGFPALHVPSRERLANMLDSQNCILYSVQATSTRRFRQRCRLEDVMSLTKTSLLAALLIISFHTSLLAQSQPLRIFIRSSEKTHGAADNGSHDYPAFLSAWTKLLTERGAVVNGGERFPTAEELAKTDVLINYSSDGANHSPE